MENERAEYEKDVNALGGILKCQYNIVGCMQKHCDTIKTIEYNKYMFDLCYFYLCKIMFYYDKASIKTKMYVDSLFNNDNLIELKHCIEEESVNDVEPPKEIIILVLSRVISDVSIESIRKRYEMCMEHVASKKKESEV